MKDDIQQKVDEGNGEQPKLPMQFRIMFFLNGVAYLMHHCGAIIVHTSICAHHVSLELVTMTLMANALQHATCFIQFTYPNVSAFLRQCGAVFDIFLFWWRVRYTDSTNNALLTILSFVAWGGGPLHCSIQVYTALVIVLEVWMDIETFTIMPVLPVFTQVGGWLIVLSHWLWISCGVATAARIALAPKQSALAKLRPSLTGKHHYTFS